MTKTYNLGYNEEENSCSIEDCKNQIELYVKEIDKLVCEKCWVAYYKRYKAYKYEAPEKASEAIKSIQDSLEEMKEYGKEKNIDNIYPNYFADLEEYEKKIDEFIHQLGDAKASNQHDQYSIIKIQALDLREKIRLSELMEDYKHYRKQNDQKFNKQNKEDNEEIKMLREEVDLQTEKVRTLTSKNDKLNNAIYKGLKDFLGKSDIADVYFDFFVDLTNEYHRKLLYLAKTISFPELSRIRIDCPKNNDPLLREFLRNCVPPELKVFSWSRWWNDDGRIDLEFYIDEIERILRVVTKEAFICYCRHTRNTLERVMKASSNANRIHIRFSKIELDANFDFSGPDYKTTYLSLSWCGSYPDVGDQWIEHPTRLEKIIKAVSECKLKDTLTTLNMFQTKMEADIVGDILKKYDMDNINIIYEDPNPLGDN